MPADTGRAVVGGDVRHGAEEAAEVVHGVLWRQLYKNRSSRKIDSQRLFSREYDFLKTFSLTENQFSGKKYFYTIASRSSLQLQHKFAETTAVRFAMRLESI